MDSVASIYFPDNGSVADIAKIAGSPAYRNVMRHATQSSPWLNVPQTPEVAELSGSQQTLGAMSLRDYLPPWLGGAGYDETTKAFATMLKSLKIATESFAESLQPNIRITVPLPPSDRYKDALNLAVWSLYHDDYPYSFPDASEFAALGNGIAGNCDYYPTGLSRSDDPERLVLTVGYFDTALTAILFYEECGAYEVRRILYDTLLSVQELSKQCSGQDLDNCLASLTHALRRLTELPLKDGNGAGLTHIGELVLHGESTDDYRLNKVLEQVFGERYNNTIARMSDKHPNTVSPVFAASRAAAVNAWELFLHRRSNKLVHGGQ